MSKAMDGDPLSFQDRDAWRCWLKKNHSQPCGIWMMFYKKNSNKASVSYEEALQEALCFGWIDSVVRKGGEDNYLQWFSPRRKGSVWSKSNIERVKAMIAQGRMTDAGLVKLPVDLENYHEKELPRMDYSTPNELEKALSEEKVAKKNYDALARSHRERYNIWINMAKRPETKAKRVAESVILLKEGKKLGLK